MAQRLDYSRVSAPLFAKFRDFSVASADGTIEKELLHLIDLRVSQLNGCAFCVDMHAKQAKIGGERELRLHHLAVWRESALFSARERAALAWAEAVTRLPEAGIPDTLYEEVREELGETEISDLTFAVVAINGWNRTSIAFRAVPGSQDNAFGLTKAGLA